MYIQYSSMRPCAIPGLRRAYAVANFLPILDSCSVHHFSNSSKTITFAMHIYTILSVWNGRTERRVKVLHVLVRVLLFLAKFLAATSAETGKRHVFLFGRGVGGMGCFSFAAVAAAIDAIEEETVHGFRDVGSHKTKTVWRLRPKFLSKNEYLIGKWCSSCWPMLGH